MTDLIDRDAAVACAMGLARSDEKCQNNGGCMHAQCLQARQIATHLRVLPSIAPPQPWANKKELEEAISIGVANTYTTGSSTDEGDPKNAVAAAQAPAGRNRGRGARVVRED